MDRSRRSRDVKEPQPSAAARTLTATRWSTLLGLWLVMLVSLPRYWLQHDMTRLALLAILMIAIAVALVAFWRLMASAQRERCPAAIKHLGGCLWIGCLLIGAWHWIDAAADHWSVILSQGTALGLLLHVVSRVWRRRH